MKKIHWTLVLVAAVAAAILVHSVGGSDERAADPPRVGAPPAARAAADRRANEDAVRKRSSAKPLRTPYDVSRAVELLNPNLFPAALAVDHEQMLMRSIAACAPVPPELQLELEKKINSLLTSEKQSVLVYQAFVRNYCEGYSETQAKSLLENVFQKRRPTPDELVTDGVVRIMLSSKTQSDLSKVDANTATALNDIATQTKSPQLYEQSLFFLLRTEHVPEAYFTGLDASTRSRFRDNPAMVHNAVATARCRLFGSCGPDSLMTMQSCFPHRCSHQSRYGDQSGHGLAAHERELVELIAGRLVAARI